MVRLEKLQVVKLNFSIVCTYFFCLLATIGTVLCETAFGDGYTYTKELFPTGLRTTALGMGSAGARVGSLSSPFIAMLDAYSPVLPLVIYGSIVLLSGIVSLWLWPETKDLRLPETLEEAEKVAATRNPWVRCCKNGSPKDK